MPLLRFYRERPVTAPTREVSDYSTEERDWVQQTFAPLALRYRFHKLIAALAMGGFILWVRFDAAHIVVCGSMTEGYEEASGRMKNKTRSRVQLQRVAHVKIFGTVVFE